MEESTIEVLLEDVKIPVKIFNDNRRNGLKITIDINGVKVYKNSSVPKEQIISLLQKKKKWVVKHYRRFLDIKEKNIERKWDKDEKILYRGKETWVQINEGNKNNTSIDFNGIHFTANLKKELNGESRAKNINDSLRDYLREEARNTISDKLKLFSGLIGVSFNNFRIKEQKTRWGSCSRKGNLNFNWKLVMAPEWVLDYVIIHELCHLIHLNHSKEFWNLVSKYMPEYIAADEWLRKNGYKLNL